MELQEIIETFEVLEPGAERYEFLIQLGRDLQGMPESEHTEDRRVFGCQSMVWMDADISDGILHLRADSDAFIVRGLIALILKIFDNKTPAQVCDLDPESTFAQIGLGQHLSMTRRNGLYSMVGRVKKLATAAL